MDNKSVPYIAFECELARAERHIKRLWILCILLVVLLVGTNALWLWYENQFEETTTTVTQELEGDNASNNFVGGDCIGEGKTDDND